MRNLSIPVSLALRLRLSLQKRGSVGRALSSYSPVGWAAGVSFGGEAPAFAWGGKAQLEEDAPAISRDTIFRVASISKIFGAAAALRLVRQGRLSLDGPASEALGFDTGRPVTLRQLITHTAALDDRPIYDEVIGTPGAPPLDAVLKGSFFPYEPGTRFRYSNLGAGVVGMMVEAASGMLFDDFVRRAFFLPHGMDASFHPQRIVHKERMANCYYVPGPTLAYDADAIAASPLEEEPNPRLHYAVPAGKLMISAPDLLGALQRLAREDAELFVRQDHIGSVRCDAGRGLGVAYTPKGVFARDRSFWGHQGQAYGALCEACIDLTDGTAAVLLTNGVRLRAVGPLYWAGQSGVAALLDRQAALGYTEA